MKNKIILIAIISLISNVMLQNLNIFYLENSGIVDNGLILTADEASYFSPPLSFLRTGEWKDSSIGYSAYYQRPPGYGFLFLVSNLLSPKDPYFIMKLIQIILFGCSVFLFGRLLMKLNISDKFILSMTLFFGLMPFFSGFMYYSLTESIVPFLILLLIYLTFCLRDKQDLLFVFSYGVVGGLSILVRPQLLILIGILTLYILFVLKFKSSWKIYLLTALLFPGTIWMIRNYTVNNEWVGIHPIYHEGNNGMYRPIHEDMGGLFRIWESNTPVFHANMNQLFSDTTKEARVSVLSTLPLEIQTSNYRKELLEVFQLYQVSSFELKDSFFRNQIIPHNGILSEEPARIKIKNITQSLKSSFPLINLVKTPFHSLYQLVASSYLNLAIFQKKYRGESWMEGFRIFSFSILFFSFLASFFVLFSKRALLLMRLLSLIVLTNVFYLAFIQRLNEERYYYVFLPVMFLLLIYSIQTFSKALKSQNRYPFN